MTYPTSEALRDSVSIGAAWPERNFVIAQLGQSLDGRIATLSGDSRWINGDAALDHLHALRARVDAVVVGVGTVIADDPQLNVRRVAGRHPARVVIDPGGRCPATAKCLAADGVRRVLIGAADAGAAEDGGSDEISRPGISGIERVALARAADGRIPPAHIVAALAELGFGRVLIEGGAATISHFLDADCIDRLHLLVGRVIIGSGKMGLELAPIDRLASARRPKVTAAVLADGDVLFDCDFRAGTNEDLFRG